MLTVQIINGEIRKQLWAKIRKEVWTAKLSFDIAVSSNCRYC